MPFILAWLHLVRYKVGGFKFSPLGYLPKLCYLGLQGRWQSLAFQRYIRQNRALKLSDQKALLGSLSSVAKTWSPSLLVATHLVE